ncbi:MAG: alpha/beta hydrolase [Hyphomonadaceae bacterium]
MTNPTRTALLNGMFEHLATPPDAADPIEAARKHADFYGRGEAGAGLAQCRRDSVSIGQITGEWLVPPDAVPGHRLVHLHGGGWIAGSLVSHRAMLAEMAVATKTAVLAIDYGLAPEAPFPTGLMECVAAIGFAAKTGPEGEASAERLYVSGDSAGGNLAAASIIQIGRTGGRLPDRLVLMSPFLTTSALPARLECPTRDPIVSIEGMQHVRSVYAASAAPDDALVEPLMGKPSELALFPPTLIQVSSAETLRDQGIAFADALWAADVEARLSIWPGLPHVWQIFVATSSDARGALTEVALFLAAN